MSRTEYHCRIKAPAAGAPIIFTFHGTGADENQFFDLVEQLLPDAGIVSPRGDVSEHGALRFFRRTAEGVYDMKDLAARTAKMAGFMRAQKAANPGVPLWALGYSNGANILASVLFQDASLVERAVLMHPLIPFQPPANPGLAKASVLITAGTRDPICPLPQTQALDRYFRAQGARVDLWLQQGGHEVSRAELARIGTFFQTEA